MISHGKPACAAAAHSTILIPSKGLQHACPPWKTTLYLFIAYWIVTLLGILLTIAFNALFHPPTPQELGVPVTQAPAYTMTLPYHPLLNLLVWPLFAWWYLRSLPPQVQPAREALRLGAFWTFITVLVDLVGWVLVPHIWRMTFAEFYIDYQPWITLIYLIIFVSPIAVARLRRKELTNAVQTGLN